MAHFVCYVSFLSMLNAVNNNSNCALKCADLCSLSKIYTSKFQGAQMFGYGCIIMLHHSGSGVAAAFK